MTSIAGQPAALYTTGLETRLARATVARPVKQEDWVTSTFSSDIYIHTPVLATAMNRPIAVGYDKTTLELSYWRATVQAPTSPTDWVRHTVDGVARGSNASIGVASIGGSPFIAYFDTASDTVKLARATVADPTMSTHWSLIVVRSTFQASGVQLTEDAGLPVLAFADEDLGGVVYARASSATPSGPSDFGLHLAHQPSFFDTTRFGIGRVNSAPSLAIKYASELDLLFVRAESTPPTMTSDWSSHAITMLDDVWVSGPQVFEHQGRAMVLYAESIGEGGALQLAQATSSTPSTSTDWSIQRISDVWPVQNVHALLRGASVVDGVPEAMSIKGDCLRYGWVE
jgi:hypothetical protein